MATTKKQPAHLFKKRAPEPTPAPKRRTSMASTKAQKYIEAAKAAKATTLRKAKEQGSKRAHTARSGVLSAGTGYAKGRGWLDRVPSGGMPKPAMLAVVGFGVSVMATGELQKWGDAAVDSGVNVTLFALGHEAGDQARQRAAQGAAPTRGVGDLPRSIPANVNAELDRLERVSGGGSPVILL
jgi:hypothetical protein